jgi:AraC family transcriptional regulator, regulatory protein of adaptative response / DNA-3-methyladenine glycosylase II
VEAFSAVVTTGIYCRPGCSARPRAENVRTFPLAAAAEAAGYRACLRCRPYRWPQSLSWTAPELVCRAVRLILDGALDRGREADLGARLGVSPRHLRRLFSAHVGVTPDGLARSARVHFARRLLDDTDLTVTEIAFAAGFGSLRQFNRACQEVFREPPRMLRARRRKADRLIADGGLRLRLPFDGPLDWGAMVAYLAARAIPGVEHVSGNSYRRTIVIGGDPGLLDLVPGGDDHLVLRAHLPHWEELVHVVQRARRIASLDFDLDAPASRLARDATIGPLLRARPGLRPPGTWSAFETGVRAIIGQQLTLTRANTVTGRLVERFGTPVPGLEQLSLTHTFPSAHAVASADLTQRGRGYGGGRDRLGAAGGVGERRHARAAAVVAGVQGDPHAAAVPAPHRAHRPDRGASGGLERGGRGDRDRRPPLRDGLDETQASPTPKPPAGSVLRLWSWRSAGRAAPAAGLHGLRTDCPVRKVGGDSSSPSRSLPSTVAARRRPEQCAFGAAEQTGPGERTARRQLRLSSTQACTERWGTGAMGRRCGSVAGGRARLIELFARSDRAPAFGGTRRGRSPVRPTARSPARRHPRGGPGSRLRLRPWPCG